MVELRAALLVPVVALLLVGCDAAATGRTPGGAWQVSEQFADDVRDNRYGGPVYLDTTSGVVFLDVVGG